MVGWVDAHFPISLRAHELGGGDIDAIAKTLLDRIKQAYAVKESVEIPEALGSLERYVVINAIDHHWQEHLTEMEDLRKSIGLRSYGQKDPLVEYKGEAYRFFEELMNNVRLQICTGLFRSASNLESFENMLALLSRTARAVGPTDLPAAAPVGTTPVSTPKAGPGWRWNMSKAGRSTSTCATRAWTCRPCWACCCRWRRRSTTRTSARSCTAT